MTSLGTNIAFGLITVVAFLVNPAAGIVVGLVGGIIAIRLANRERRLP